MIMKGLFACSKATKSQGYIEMAILFDTQSV